MDVFEISLFIVFLVSLKSFALSKSSEYYFVILRILMCDVKLFLYIS